MNITEIRTKLNAAIHWEPWMDELQADPRKGVQALLAGWHRRQAHSEALTDALHAKQAFDRSYCDGAQRLVAGVDEAGRGPLAGPVVTAAVILPDECPALAGLDDSKKLSKARRETFAKEVKRLALSYAVHIQSHDEIDRLNIYEATKQSMAAAVGELSRVPDIVLADAMKLPTPMPCHSIIKGDAKSLAIAAASVLAKTERDALMDAYDEMYPVYGFRQHAGYGTRTHLEAIALHGPSPIHRKTFKPVRSFLK